MKPKLFRITWYLTGARQIVKIDEGAQQAFLKMTREERMMITLDCIRTTTKEIQATPLEQ